MIYPFMVYLETDHGPASAQECAAVQERLHKGLEPDVGTPYGSLAVTLVVQAEYVNKAVQLAEAVFSEALLRAQVALDSSVVRAEVWEPTSERRDVPALITHRGLAELFSISRQYVNRLMERKGAPEPVEVEGSDRAAIYVRDQAKPYIASRLRP